MDKPFNRPLILLTVAVALLLVGCEVRIHADMVVNEDETGTFTVELAVDEELAALAGGDFSDELSIDTAPEDWAVEAFVEDGYEGVRATIGFDSLDRLVSLLDELTVDDAGVVGAIPGFLYDILPTRVEDDFTFRLNIPEEMGGFFGEEFSEIPIPLELDMLDSVFDVRFTLVLPGEIVTSNADVVTGDTLVWNLSLTDGGRVLEAHSRLENSNQQMIIMWGAIGLAVAVVLILVVRIRSGRKAAGSVPDEPESVSGVDNPDDGSEADNPDDG